MSLSFSDLTKRLFRRFTGKHSAATPHATRARLSVQALEDRTVPTTVTIAALADATEGGSSGTFRLTRSDTSGFLGVTLTLSGTAAGGEDYIADNWATFADGVATADVTVSAEDDEESEPTETVVATVAGGMMDYDVGTPASATVRVFDNDAQYVSVAKIDDAVEGGATGKFRVTRIGDLSSSQVVNVSVGGTATSGTDFTSLGSSVTFAAHSATADVNVTAAHDSVDDADETVTLTVTSGTGYSVGSPYSTSLDVIDVGDLLPEAFDASVTTSVNVDADVTVLDFASDLDGDTLTVTGVTQGENGTVVLNLDGTVTYTPDTDFVGDDSFTYTLEDQFGNESTGTVYVTMTAPVAVPTSVWTDVDTPINIDAVDLAFDPDGDELTVPAVTQGDHGTVTIETDGTVTYTPDTSFEGEDSFTYTVEDPDGNAATHTITVTVGESDPVALDDSATTAVNTALNVTIADVAFDPSGDTVTATAVTQGAHGTVVINVNGTVTYTPNTGFSGTDSFTYTVEDSNSNPATGTISVRVGAAPPTDADEIEGDLDDMLDEIENPDENTPNIVDTAVSSIVDAVANYLDSTSLFLSTNNINTLGPNKSAKDFAEAMGPIYRGLFSNVFHLAAIEDLLYQSLLANKALIESLNQQLKMATNPIQIGILTQSLNTLKQVHNRLTTMWGNVNGELTKQYFEAQKVSGALAQVLPNSVYIRLIPLPNLPFRDPFAIVPKLP